MVFAGPAVQVAVGIADTFPDDMLNTGARCAVTSWVTRATIWSIVDCVNKGPALEDTTVVPVPGKLRLTGCWLPDDAVVVAVGLGALTATDVRAGPVANLFDRRGGGAAERRLGGIWKIFNWSSTNTEQKCDTNITK